MKSEKLYDAFGDIDEDIIEEAHRVQPDIKKQSKYKFIKYLSGAALIFLVVGISLGNILNDTNNDTNSGVIEQLTDEREGIEYVKSDELQKISVTLNMEGMGGGEIGNLIVKKSSDMASDNPTRNNYEALKSLSQLPVFKNEENLWKEYNKVNEKDIENLVYFDQPTWEDTLDYSTEGISNQTWRVCYKKDVKKKVLDQLLDYTFYRVEYAKYNEDKDGIIEWVNVMTPPSEKGILYPIISLEEAKEKLRKGDFLCSGGEDSVAETAKILSVEIIYLTDKEQTHLQPFYRFMITDESWDLKSILDDFEWKNPEEFISISPVFVPAVSDEYLELKDELHFN